MSLIFALFFAGWVHAADVQNAVCGNALECGTFQAEEKLPDGQTVTRVLVIEPVAKHDVALSFQTVVKGKTSTQARRVLTFKDNGIFTAEDDGEARAAGV
jgi:hypothetical protein